MWQQLEHPLPSGHSILRSSLVHLKVWLEHGIEQCPVMPGVAVQQQAAEAALHAGLLSWITHRLLADLT